jgi:hypothetical protein
VSCSCLHCLKSLLLIMHAEDARYKKQFHFFSTVYFKKTPGEERILQLTYTNTSVRREHTVVPSVGYH